MYSCEPSGSWGWGCPPYAVVSAQMRRQLYRETREPPPATRHSRHHMRHHTRGKMPPHRHLTRRTVGVATCSGSRRGGGRPSEGADGLLQRLAQPVLPVASRDAAVDQAAAPGRDDRGHRVAARPKGREARGRARAPLELAHAALLEERVRVGDRERRQEGEAQRAVGLEGRRPGQG